jgi:DNA processing protein
LLYGVGPKTARELMTKLGSIDRLFETNFGKLSKSTGMRTDFFKKMKRENALEIAEEAIQFHNNKGIKSLFFTEDGYPRRLKHFSDSPTMLYQIGEMDLNEYRFVAIVGTRSATQYGKEICRQLIASFSGKKIVVVSGLAHGIDSFAHKFCIEYNVPTIAVLGHGLDRIYPSSNRALAKKIIQNGALLTEFVPGTNPDRENFPKRNRIVAGMCDATIIIESRDNGGSLITAQLANDYNKDVFAYPGNVDKETSSGCNLLIANQKAHLITSPQQFLEMMGWDDESDDESPQMTCYSDLSEQQTKILSIMSSEEFHIDEISGLSGIPIAQLIPELFELQLSFKIQELPGKRYKKTPLY